MFRNPLYLNVPMLRRLADYQGLDVPGDKQVVRRTRGEKTGHLGVGKIIEAGREGTSEDELIETFTDAFRPVRTLNDVVDSMLADEVLVDLSADPAHAISRRTIIQLDGQLGPSPLTEIAAVMSALIPSLIDQTAEGATEFHADMSVLMRAFLQGGTSTVTHVFEMSQGEQRFLLLVEPEHLMDATMDDLDDDLSVLATVDRIIAAGQTKRLDRFVLPNLSRMARRALSGQALDDVVTSFGEAVGNDLTAESLNVEGPAVILHPVAIY